MKTNRFAVFLITSVCCPSLFNHIPACCDVSRVSLQPARNQSAIQVDICWFKWLIHMLTMASSLYCLSSTSRFLDLTSTVKPHGLEPKKVPLCPLARTFLLKRDVTQSYYQQLTRRREYKILRLIIKRKIEIKISIGIRRISWLSSIREWFRCTSVELFRIALSKIRGETAP